MAVKGKQLMAIQHVYSCLASTLERQNRHIAITDLQAMFVHGAAVFTSTMGSHNTWFVKDWYQLDL